MGHYYSRLIRSAFGGGVAGLAFIGLSHLNASELTLKEEFGRSSLSAVFDEEEDDAKFTYWATGLDFEHGSDKAKAHAEAGRRQRDYKTRRSDLTVNHLGAGAWQKTDFNGETVRLGGRLQWREKTFETLSAQSYHESAAKVFAYGYQGWDVNLAASHYDYPLKGDENKLGFGVAKTHERGPLKLTTEAKAGHHWAGDRLKFKKEGGISARWDPGIKPWKRSFFSADFGQRDTKADEEREDDLDYSFWELRWHNWHPAGGPNVIDWKLKASRKDDKEGIYSHRGMGADLQWRTDFERKNIKLKVWPSAGFKRMTFWEAEAMTYTKKTLGLGASTRLGAWQAKAETRIEFYDYPKRQDRRTYPVARLHVERTFAETVDLSIGAGLRDNLFSLSGKVGLRI
ncbi:MAG: hypothetical protein HY747_02995 [Elusimicrobia bacterium]|nr:hypothetical protein [Elusimicrobiota bacterium]